MNEIIDLLQIRIEKAKRELPEETQNAIAAVDWRAAILSLRAKTGYTFEQLGDLELETELLLSGLLRPEDYPKELEKRMEISRAMANELVNEMNDLVFKKIREELIKNTERKKIFAGKTISETTSKTTSKTISKTISTPIVESAIPNPIKIKIADNKETLPVMEKLELMGEPARPGDVAHPILEQKLSGTFQVPVAKTDHSLNNLSQNNTGSAMPKIDPYRELPE